jgi:type I restriction enzyme, S subunit
MNWNNIKIGDIADVRRGASPRPINDFIAEEGMPWLKIADIEDNGKYIKKTKEFIIYNGISKSVIVHPGYLVLSNSATPGIPQIMKITACIHDGWLLLSPKKEFIDKDFLYYLLKYNRKKLLNDATGAVFNNLRTDTVANFEVKIPELNKQKMISDILSAYDNLINTNKERIQYLEEAARLLYREWFVYFRFPGHQQVKFIDGIPEGWENTKIKKLGQIITGKTPSKKNSRNFNGNIPFIKTPDMHKAKIILNTEETLSEIGVSSQKNKVLPSWSILVSCIGTVGVVAMNLFKSQTNQQINSVIPKNKYYRYYSYFCLSRIKPLLEAIGGGSTMANINKNKFENIKIVVPTENLLIEFYHLVDPIFNQIALLLDQNQKLAQARDLLLPRLMSGKIDVSNFDKDSIPVESEVEKIVN